MRFLRYTSKEFEKICQRRFSTKKKVSQSVRQILEDVKKYGDKALLYYTKKFDKVSLKAKDLKITESEISGAFQNIDSEFLSCLKKIIHLITNFYKAQLKNFKFKIKTELDSVIQEIYFPLESVGIYIPAGQAPLISTVYMTAIPANVAGVKRIVLISPPDKDGKINPYILAVASLLKIKEIYRVGGAQGIAALAFGTKTIKPVNKIIGPGGIYVTEAKRQVFGFVDIDMLAGPSELVILASDETNFEWIVQDLKAQAEHINGEIFLITDSKKLANYVKNRIDTGFIIMVRDLEIGAELVNKIAPEHLQLIVKNPKKILRLIKNCGAIFVGEYSPTSVGDYIAGPSHVLPTFGTARFFSDLNLHQFFKSFHIIEYSKKELEENRKLAEKIAELEGMKEHSKSIKIRFSYEKSKSETQN